MIEPASHLPGGILKRPEVCLPHVFHENETVSTVVAYKTGHGNTDTVEKKGNVCIIGVFNTLRVIMDQDGRILLVPFKSEESSGLNLSLPGEQAHKGETPGAPWIPARNRSSSLSTLRP